MYISEFNARNFRNFKNLDVHFDRGFIVIQGPNGAGKTNLLEGLWYTSTLTPFAESSLNALFYNNTNVFRTTNYFIEKSEQHSQSIGVQKTKKSYQYKKLFDGRTLSRREYTQKSACMLFLPQDLQFFTRSPNHRRRMLDVLLSNIFSHYQYALTQYVKALRQRNEFLSLYIDQNKNTDMLTVWNNTLATHGAEITKTRAKYIDFIQTHISQVLRQIAPEITDLIIKYNYSGHSDEQQFIEKLYASKEKEQERHTTLIGPHRDDVQAFINRQKASEYLSRGQLRSLILALKIVERMFFIKERKTEPIILLDDVFSEFDDIHQKQLASFLEQFEQIFLTTAHPSSIQDTLPPHTVYQLRAGNITN